MMEGVAVLREVFRAVDVTAVGTDEPQVRNITSRAAARRPDHGSPPDNGFAGPARGGCDPCRS